MSKLKQLNAIFLSFQENRLRKALECKCVHSLKNCSSFIPYSVSDGSLWNISKVPLFITEKLICRLLFKKGFVSHLRMGITEPLAKGQNISVPTVIIIHELVE